MTENSHFPYFTRSGRYDKTLRLSNENNFMYELKGLARTTSFGIDTFLNYFECPYNQHYHRLCREQGGPENIKFDNTHISEFFMVFLEIYLLQSCIGLNEKIISSTISAVNDLFGPEPNKEYASIKHFIKKRIEIYFNQYFRERFFWSDPSTYKFQQSFIKVQKKIEEILYKYFERVENNIEQIKAKECLPQNFDNQFLKMFIRYNFQRIRNAHVLRRSFKNEVLTEFQQTARRHMFIRIQFLIETLTPKNKNNNLIYLPKYSRETYPILNEFFNYIALITRQKDERQGDFQLVLYAHMKKIVEICRQYHEDTRSIYPNLSIQDFMVDYRSLHPIISHNSLILDGLGFRGQTKSIELRLATEPCPQFKTQESHLQSQQKWAFVRKYYCPRKSTKDRDKIQIQLENAKLRLQISEANIQQNVYVWRLLNILSEIANQTNIAGNEAQKLRLSKLNLYDYRQRVKQIYNDLKEGKLKFQDVIPVSKKIVKYKEQGAKEVKQTNKDQNFQFQMAYIALRFDIESNHDSLLYDLRFQNIKQYLEQRDYFSHQINFIILYQKAFKKLMNAKKYVISFFTNAIQILHFNIILRDPAQSYAFRKELTEYLQLHDFFYGLHKRSSTIKAVLEKLDDYQSRNDTNHRYLANSKLYQIIKWISNAIQEINILKDYEYQDLQPRQDENELRKMAQDVLEKIDEQEDIYIKEAVLSVKKQIEANNTPQQGIPRKIRKIINDTIYVKSKFMMLQAIQHFSNFIRDQIKPFIDDPSVFHNNADLKLQKPIQRQVFKYINYKLITVIEMYLTLTLSTFRRSQQMYFGSVFDILREGKRINQDITGLQIEIKMQRMLVCRNYIRHQTPSDYFREHKGLLVNIQDNGDQSSQAV